MTVASSCAAPLDVVVVGGGISGLVAASILATRVSRIRVLEARSRVGGRLLSTQDGVDLGASWWWAHDTSAKRLAQRFSIQTVPQHLTGTAWMQRGGRAQQVGDVSSQIAPCGPGASRFAGGYAQIPGQLAASLPAGTVELGARVVALEHQPGSNDVPAHIKVTYATGVDADVPDEVLYAKQVVLALPPRLSSAITFSPSLPPRQQATLAQTATWCGDWAKVVASFRSAFWRRRGESGTISTPGGLVEMWWEASGGPEAGERAASLAGLGFGAKAASKLDRHGLSQQADGDSLSGQRVLLHGLTSRADLNGRDGIAGAYDSEAERYAVQLDGETVKVRAANLRRSELRSMPGEGDDGGLHLAAGSPGVSPAALRAEVVAELGTIFGTELVERELVSVTHKAWMTDPLTYAPPPGGSERGDPRSSYGHPLLRTPTEWGVHFAGTESEAESGHVAGAIAAGERAADEVMAALQIAH